MIENKKNNLIKKLVIPLFIYLILVGLISIITLFYLENKHIFEHANNTFDKTIKNFDNKFNEDVKTYESFIKLISKDTKAIELFQSQNREALYQYYQGTYKNFKNKFNVSHFYFHKKNKVNFLRVHNKNKHSDLIDRVTLQKSVESKSLGQGIEFGVFHNLTLRVVYPWFVNNEIIGYIELGKEIDYFTPELASLNNTDIVFTINKNYITKKDYDKWIDSSKNNKKFEELNDFYVIDSSLKNHSEELNNILDTKENLINEEVNNFLNHYHVFSKPFVNIDGETIGKMYVLSNLTQEYDFLIGLIFKVCFIIVFFFVILVIYYVKLVKKQENIIEEKHDTIINQSITDSLTSLYNKRYFDYNLPLIVKSCQDNNAFVSFIIADIDNFKAYNDNYGHQKGDDILKEVAFQIQNTFKRSDDKCYRIGGEEFAILVESENENVGYTMAELMRKNIEELNLEHRYNSDINKITISVGVYTTKANKLDKISHLYKNADNLLYKAKNSGRNQVQYTNS